MNSSCAAAICLLSYMMLLLLRALPSSACFFACFPCRCSLSRHLDDGCLQLLFCDVEMVEAISLAQQGVTEGATVYFGCTQQMLVHKVSSLSLEDKDF